jgi:membrane protein implicated in regulation of membrane protease activity
MESPESWRWVWLVTAFVFATGELFSPGSFFLLPFGIGAGVACVLAFLDVNLAWQWLAFVVVSGGMFAALFPLRKRLDRDSPQEGIGSKRMIGQTGIVLEDIPAGPTHVGLVRVGREEWRAETADGSAVPAGTTVRVVDLVGTRLVVWPAGTVAPASADEPTE